MKNLKSLLDLFPWKNKVTTTTVSLSLSQTVTECGRVHTQVWKRIQTNELALGTNHTKIYRVNLVGFKHNAEDPSRSPHHQNKYTLRSKRFSNVLTNHQGRFPETVPEAKQLTYRGTSHKRLTLMILHTEMGPKMGPFSESSAIVRKNLKAPETGPDSGPIFGPPFLNAGFRKKWLLAGVAVTITIFHSFSLVFAANMTACVKNRARSTRSFS